MLRFLTALIYLSGILPAHAQQLTIHIHADTSIHRSLTGRLYIFTQTDTTQRVGDPNPFSPTPTFYKDVRDWNNTTVQVFDSTAHAFPDKLNKLKAGYYKFTAVLDVNREERSLQAPGNYYSRDVIAEVKENGNREVYINLKGIFRERAFTDNDSVKQIVLKSKLLSTFHHKDISVKAAIILPASYSKESSKEYPIVFVIPGWGGTHYDAQSPFPGERYGFRKGKEKIYVYLNPDTQSPFGLHAFVDSRVNGPWGKALVEELIPFIGKNYRMRKDPLQHFIMGQSTGGYGALWLQLNYPKAFGGCWAVSPDPVDFSDFTSVNIYSPNVNFYFDEQGKERPFFLWEGKYVSTLKAFCQFEEFIGDGGQMQAFDAEFGKPGKDGRPVSLFDPKTGKVDAQVAISWKPYDMGLYIQQNWKKLEKDLHQKVHVYAGTEDNFYLDGAVLRLKEKAQSVNADVVAELIPKSNHFSIWNPAFTKRVQQEIDRLIKD